MEYTRPATWDDVKTLARYFAEAGVEYALVGGYAIAAHGFNRFSEDIDVLVEPSPANARRWIAALSRLPDSAAADLADEPDVFAADNLHAIRINDEFTVDVMPAVAGLTWTELAHHITLLDVEAMAVPVLGLAGLLKTTQGAGPKDQVDAVVLRTAVERLARGG